MARGRWLSVLAILPLSCWTELHCIYKKSTLSYLRFVISTFSNHHWLQFCLSLPLKARAGSACRISSCTFFRVKNVPKKSIILQERARNGHCAFEGGAQSSYCTHLHNSYTHAHAPDIHAQEKQAQHTFPPVRTHAHTEHASTHAHSNAHTLTLIHNKHTCSSWTGFFPRATTKLLLLVRSWLC